MKETTNGPQLEPGEVVIPDVHIGITMNAKLVGKCAGLLADEAIGGYKSGLQSVVVVVTRLGNMEAGFETGCAGVSDNLEAIVIKLVGVDEPIRVTLGFGDTGLVLLIVLEDSSCVKMSSIDSASALVAWQRHTKANGVCNGMRRVQGMMMWVFEWIWDLCGQVIVSRLGSSYGYVHWYEFELWKSRNRRVIERIRRETSTIEVDRHN